MSDKFIVYIHRNKINQKVYVGITSQRVKGRWQNGRGYKKQPRFYNAIEKYGWDSFEHIIVAEGLTRYSAGKMEQKLIEELDSTNKTYGYNISLGGDGPESVSDDTKKKMSEAMVKRFENPLSHKQLSDAQKERYMDADERKKQQAIIMKYCHAPESDSKRGATLKKRYEDPNERKKISDAVKQYYIDRPEISASLTARNNKRYEDAAEHEKTSKANYKRFSDEKERKKISVAIKQYYSTPEGKANKSAAMKRRWSDPAERAKQSERIRKAKAKRRQQLNEDETAK